MASKQYLDQEGLERLVQYIQTALQSKADVGAIPSDVVLKSELEELVNQTDLSTYVDVDELTQALSNVVRDSDIADVVRDADIENVVRNSDIADVVRDSDIADVVREAALDEALVSIRESLGSVYHFRGSVDNLEALNAVENPEVGDVYNIADTGMNAGWTGEVWDYFGSITDLTDYLTKEEVDSISIPVVDSILYGGKSAVVSNKNSIDLMLANNEPKVEIRLSENLTVAEPIQIPEGKEVVLDLGGNELKGSNLLQVAGGKLTLKNGSVKATNGDGVIATAGAEVVLDGASVISNNHNGVSATDSTVTVNSGSITSQEAGIAGFKNSNIVINGGTITGVDNGPIMGNGSPAGADNDGSNMNVVMNGGTLIAHIMSAGYLACGVYVPNTGSFTMNGGQIISDGCGICMRGGQVNLNGGEIHANGTSGAKGKVGDSRVVVGPYAVVYDAQSKYPGMSTLELNIAKGMVLEGTDGDIDYVLQDGVEANVNDNR